MQNFIARQNIGRFERLHEREPDPSRRKCLEDMLAEERAKLYGDKPLAIPPDPGAESRPTH